MPELNLTAGRLIGFDIAVDDADRTGKKKSQIVWRGQADNSAVPTRFGRVKLVKP